MLPWIVPLVGLAGILAFRSWKQDVAIRSGELMDVRDVDPSGDVDIEVCVLADRLYRVELHVEGVLNPSMRDRALPCRLIVTKADSDACGEIVHDEERVLGELLPFAAGRETDAAGHLVFWGSLPLLEFNSESLLRLRFELTVAPNDDVGGVRAGQIVKAAIVVKEGVRPLRASGGILPRIRISDDRAL